MRTLTIMPLWLALCYLAPAAADTGKANTPPSPTVEVPGAAQDRDEKSYRSMLAGVDIFERNRNLAPGAELRFKLLPRQAGVAMEGLTLELSGANTKIALPLAADQTFSLPRNADAANDNAAVRSNRKDKSLTWRADIRSPNVPPNAKRLGDLLLECKVAMAGDLVAYIHHPINIMITKMDDPCRSMPINMFNFADRALFSVTLVDGNRRSAMPATMLHGPEYPVMAGQQDWTFLRERVYMVKFKALYEKGWSDDTLLQFDYMDDDKATE